MGLLPNMWFKINLIHQMRKAPPIKYWIMPKHKAVIALKMDTTWMILIVISSIALTLKEAMKDRLNAPVNSSSSEVPGIKNSSNSISRKKFQIKKKWQSYQSYNFLNRYILINLRQVLRVKAQYRNLKLILLTVIQSIMLLHTSKLKANRHLVSMKTV